MVEALVKYMQIMIFFSVLIPQEMISPLETWFKVVFPQSCWRNESGNKTSSDRAHIYQDLNEPHQLNNDSLIENMMRYI